MTIRYLENLRIIENENDVIVIVPPEDVVITEITLPKLNKHKLIAAIPYALEEQLATDVTEYHFAISEQQENGLVAIAVVAKVKMQHWLTLLSDNNIAPHFLIPLTLALPYHDEQWEIYSLGKLSIVRSGKFSGFAVDTQNLSQILGDNYLQHALTETLLDELLVNNQYENTINLLQRNYSQKRKSKPAKHLWKYTAYAAGSWILLVFLSNLISLSILHAQENKLHYQIAMIYHKHFPDSKNIVAPRERIEQKLKQIENSAQQNNFLSLLAIVSKAFTENHGVRILQLTYQQPILTIAVSAGSFEALDAITQTLSEHGLTVKQENAATISTHVKATLLINTEST